MFLKILNIDFENVIPCINLFLMYILNFIMVNRQIKKLFLPILKKKLKLQKVCFEISIIKDSV